MTDQLKVVKWTDIPVVQQRRLIAVLGRLVYRHLVATTLEEFSSYRYPGQLLE